MTGPDESQSSKHLKAASDSFRNGITGVFSGLVHLLRGFREWLNTHPLLGLLILAPISAIIADWIFRTIGAFYTLFYGKTAVISNDLLLTTLPIPVGLSIYILFTLWLLTTVFAYLRLSDLRERVEELEST